MRSLRNLFVVLLAGIAGYAPTAMSVPQSINYQGQLADPSGAPLDTTIGISLGVYDSPLGGAVPLWGEAYMITVENGLFNIEFNLPASLNNLCTGDLWLGVTVGADVEMTPRHPITSVPHSYCTGTVDGASGGTITGDVTIQGKLNVGSGNTNAGTQAFVVGLNNVASGNYSSVTGGDPNVASGQFAHIGGGQDNLASGDWSSILGGQQNQATFLYSTVGGGRLNNSWELGTTVAGGTGNTAFNMYTTVSGGYNNYAHFNHATCGGGETDSAWGYNSFVGGGWNNLARGDYSTVGGGAHNRARGFHAVVAGGGGSVDSDSNSATGDQSTVGGGFRNLASGLTATVAGGYDNDVFSNYGAIGGGQSNVAWQWATIPGGYNNNAGGNFSFAAGRDANASNVGSFVWGSSSTNSPTVSHASYAATFRCEGGARFYTHASNITTGVNLPAGGGAWANLCDVNEKNLHGGVNTSEVLNKVSSLALHRWSYKTQDETIQHIGPTAQDFYAAFGLGDNNTTISTLDPDGVALAAIQELAKENADLKARLARLESQLQSHIASAQQSLQGRQTR